MKTRICMTALGLSLLAGAAGAATTYTSAPTGGTISSFAVPNTTTYGEIITAPSAGGSTLESFSFWISGDVAQAFGGVGTWTGTGIGTSLFQSVSFSASYDGLTEVTVDTGGVDLTAGQQYVIYFSNAITGNSGSDAFGVGSGSSLDNGGGMVWDNASGSTPVNNQWSYFCGGCYNLAYTATFDNAAAVPEPASIALFGFGLLGLAVTRRRED